MRLLFLVALLCSGCAGSFEEAKTAGTRERAAQHPGVTLGVAPVPSEYCQRLDSQRAWLGGGAKTFALGGAATAASVPMWASDEGKIRAALIAGGVSAVGGGLMIVADGKSTTWARYCAN